MNSIKALCANWFLVVLLAVVISTGCSKKEAAAPAEAGAAQAEGGTAAAPAQPANAPAQMSTKDAQKALWGDKKSNSKQPAAAPTVINQPIQGEVHAFMTSQLRVFLQQKGRMPNDFSEFTSARMDSVPFPPPGKRYVIDAQTVTVKIVKQ